MASRNRRGIPDWGKPYVPLPGVLRLSLYHGRGLRAPLFFDPFLVKTQLAMCLYGLLVGRDLLRSILSSSRKI
jgi:hypothetical protein